MAKRKKSSRRSAPWKRAAPKGSSHHSLTPAKKAAAKRRAQKAGRPYPNLVDNMRAARGKKTARKAKKKARAKRKARSKTKDPHGGLTAAGRREFARKDGAHLKPGVRRKAKDMTPQDMRRKGSWATRFYGREGALPPLRDSKGKPTRFALTAAAWGERVPKTVAAARGIAAKGKRLLERYNRTKSP